MQIAPITAVRKQARGSVANRSRPLGRSGIEGAAGVRDASIPAPTKPTRSDGRRSPPTSTRF